MPRIPTSDDHDLFELQALEPRVLLSGEGFFAGGAARELTLHALPEASIFQTAIVETVDSRAMTASLSEPADGLFAAAAPITAAAEVTSSPAASVSEWTTFHSLTLAATAITPTVAAPLLESTLPISTLPNGPPGSQGGIATPSTRTFAIITADTLPLAASITTGLDTLKTQLPTWGAFFNLSTINWAAQGLSSLSLPVLPDALNNLFGLGSRLSGVSLPDFGTALDKAGLVSQMTTQGFTIRSIEGGFSSGPTTIAASIGTTLIEASYTLAIASGFSIAGDFAGDSFNDATPSVLSGLAGSANLNGAISWSGNLSLSINFLYDSSAGFLLLGDSALNLAVTGTGTLSGTAPVGGASGTAITGTANASLGVALGFRDPTARYTLTQFNATNISATATGTAGLSLSLATGPVSLTFGATYNLTANLATRAVTQSVALTLTGRLDLPGVKTAGGAPGSVTLTGAFNTGSQTWTISGSATSGLQMFGQTLNQLSVTTTITPSALSGSFTSQLTLDFLGNGSSPAVVNLSATYDQSVVSVTASATIATLNLGGTGSNRLLALTDAALGGTFSGNVATGALTGSLTISAATATFQPDQTAYIASISDGTDADAFGLIGSYDFGTSAFSLAIDQFTLAVSGVFRAVASGFTFNYDRTRTDPAQVIAELNSVKIDLLAMQQTGSPEPPSITISKLSFRQNGFAFANATATLGDYTLGGAIKFGSLAVTLTDIAYTTGSAPAGTLGLNAASATLFPGASTTATLTTISGSFNLVTKAFGLTIANLNATIGTTLTITGTNLGFGYDPTGPPEQKIITVDTLTVALPSASVTGTLTGLEVTAAGGFSAVSLALDTAGLAKTLGLGELLPFDITSLFGKFRGDTNGNGVRDPGETFSLTEFDLTVRGAFDFSKLASLPFTPIIRIGPQGANQQSFAQGTAQPFEFTVTVSGTGVKPKDIGPIEVGFSDLKIGSTVTLGGTVILGGYQDGSFVPTFGGSFSLLANNNVKTITGSASATLTGTFDTAAHTIAATGSITVGFTYGDKVDIRNAQLGFALALKADGGFAVSVTSLALTSGSVGSVSIKFGSLMTLSATGATFDFTATGSAAVATFASMTATFPGLANLSGTATKFGFAADGTLLTQTGFGVTISADSGAIKWPSWLPISIDKLGIVWKNFAADPLDFSIILSASVTSLNGVSGLNVQGTVKDAIIDIGLLQDGKFPITGLGAIAVSVSGDIFGGAASGSLVLGIIRLDAQGNRIAGQDLTTPVAERILYGGIEAGFSFGGMAGFGIRIGVSELGPLQVYLKIDQVQILEPISGLAISGFRAGVTFNTELPSITDPLKLRDPQFKTAPDLTLNEWVTQLESAVINQARAPPGGGFWNVFTQPMRIEGGATLFSAYASTGSFRADVDILFDTRGKVVINARGVFGGTFSLNFRLYADLTQIQNSGTFLFLAELPPNPTTLTLRGSLQFKFLQANGQPASFSAPASSFFLSLSGGVDATLLSVGSITVEATVNLTITATRGTLDFNGTLKMGPLGDAVKAAGKFIFQNTGSGIELWGVGRLEVKFNQLESQGLFAEGSALLQLNTTSREITESVTLPGESAADFKLKAQSFSVIVDGALQLKQAGANWFRLQGLFVLELTTSGLDLLVDANLLVGDPTAPLVTLKAFGYFAIRSNGVAARVDLALIGSFGGSGAKLTLEATFQLVFNTTGTAISYTLPAAANPVSGSRTVTVSGQAPGTTTAGPYFFLDIRGSMTIDGAFTLSNGTFTLLVTPATVRLEAAARLELSVSTTKLFGFEVSGGFDLASGGVAGVFSLTLRDGVPTGQGWSLTGTFRLEFNTRSSPVTLGGVTVRAGTVRVFADGTVTASGFKLTGTFNLTVARGDVQLDATAKVTLLGATFDVRAVLGIFSDGLAFKIQVDVPEIKIKSLAFSLKGRFALAINTSKTARGDLAAGSGYLFAEGVKLTLAGFTVSGTVRISSQGRIDIPSGDPLTLAVLHEQATFSGYVDLSTGYFDLAAVINLDLGTKSIAGIAGALNLRLYRVKTNGREASGLDGTFSAVFNAFGIKIANLTGSTSLSSDGSFRLQIDAGFTLADFVSITGRFSLSVDASQNIALTFDGRFDIFGQFKSELSGKANTRDGTWSLVGSASANFGTGNIGASLCALVVLGNVPYKETYPFAGITLINIVQPGLYISGSAWAKVEVAGLKFGIEGSFSTSLTGGSARVHVEGSICAGICVSASKDVSINFRTGKVSLSNIGYATVFLDLNRNGRHDSGEPITLANVDGLFSFDPPPANLTDTAAPATAFALLDLNGDGRLTADEGRFLLTGGRSLGDGPLNPDTLTLNEGALTGSTDYAGATVFFDVNGNGVCDDTEFSVTTDASGLYSFQQLLVAASGVINHLGRLQPFDANHNGVIDPGEGDLLLVGGTSLTDGTANVGPLLLGNPEGHALYGGATVFLDLNGNGQLEANEPSTQTSAEGFYAFDGDQDSVESGALGLLAAFDANHNGVIDPGEGVLRYTGGRFISPLPEAGVAAGDAFTGTASLETVPVAGRTLLAGATVFLDLNGNDRVDPGEASVTTGADGSYSFRPDTIASRVAALGGLAPFDANHNGALEANEGRLVVVGGVRLGVDHGPNDPFFDPDVMFEANSPNGVLHWADAVVFLDLNGNGRIDAGEPQTATDANGFYTFLAAADFHNDLGTLKTYDLNGNGVIDPAEGVFVITGGTDLDTGLANRRTLTVLATNYGSIFGTQITPLSELYSYLVLGGLSPDQANEVLRHAFGLPNTVDAMTFDLFTPGLQSAGQSAAKLVSTLAQTGAEIIVSLDEVRAAAAGRAPIAHGDAEDFVILALADYIRRLGPPTTTEVDASGNHIGGAPALDFHDEAVLRQILVDAISRTGLALPFTDRLNATITALHHIMDQVLELRDAGLTDITGALARVNAVVELNFHPALDDLISGRLSVADFSARFTDANLHLMLRAVNIPETNSPPTVNLVGPAEHRANDVDAGQLIAVRIRVSDPDDLPSAVDIDVTSSNPSLVSVARVRIVGTGAERTVLVTLLPGRTGTATITLRATDGQSGGRAGIVTQQFTVTILYTYAGLMNDLAIRARHVAAEANTLDARERDDTARARERFAVQLALSAAQSGAPADLVAAIAPVPPVDSPLVAATNLGALEATRPMRGL